MLFVDLRLSEPLLRAVASEGYTIATPIQAQAIPPVLEGRDVLGCAQTGTGKTAAFALPILQRLTNANGTSTPHNASRGHAAHNTHAASGKSGGTFGGGGARCLVLCPTRELAVQIETSFRTYGKNLRLHPTAIYGGVNQFRQVEALRRGADIIVATPGRLQDLMEQGHVDLRGIETLVLDEADRMLDMGFIDDIRRIVAKVPAQRQTLLFSATMPPPIRRLADTLLRNPVTLQIAPPASTADGIDQSVYFVEKRNKPALLAHLMHTLSITRALVFTRTKHGADRVVRSLYQSGIRAEAIHGNKTQNNRQRALDGFRSGKTHVLVATDIASRGIDVDGISHVVNFDLSHEPETYIHRIGRTARAGATGVALSFCDREEVSFLRAIERLIRRPLTVKAVDGKLTSGAPLAAPADDFSPETDGYARPPRRPTQTTCYGQRPTPGSPGAYGTRASAAQHAPPRTYSGSYAPRSGQGAGHAAQSGHTTGSTHAGNNGHGTGHTPHPSHGAATSHTPQAGHGGGSSHTGKPTHAPGHTPQPGHGNSAPKHPTGQRSAHPGSHPGAPPRAGYGMQNRSRGNRHGGQRRFR